MLAPIAVTVACVSRPLEASARLSWYSKTCCVLSGGGEELLLAAEAVDLDFDDVSGCEVRVPA